MKTDHIFNISINKRQGKGPKKLKFLEDRSPSSENVNIQQWNFSNSQPNNIYYYIDSYRFGTGTGKSSGTLNLANYNIILSISDKNYPSLDKMYMQIGNQSLRGKKLNNGRRFRFNLGASKGVSNYLKSNDFYPDNRSTRSFTFFEYPTKATNKTYFGKNNIVVTVGPDAYTGLIGSDNAINSSELKNWEDLQFNNVDIGGEKYNIKVGALADQLLQQSKRKAINFKFDQALDASQTKATQAIIFQTVDSPPEKNWQRFMLDWDQPISVGGSAQEPGAALIDGGRQRQSSLPYTGDSTGFGKFFNSMLEVSSTYKPSKTAKYGTAPSTSIQGMTFLDPPSRGEGTVQVNSTYVPHIRTSSWWDKDYNKNDDLSTTSAAYMDRLVQSIQLFQQAKASNSLTYSVPSKVRSELFDNQIIGGWAPQSDGIEDATARLISGRNFYHVNDDSIKLLNRGQTFLQNTIHQGQAGAPLSFGYGASGNDVQNVTSDGLYIHRITQPAKDNDPLLGLILDSWSFRGKSYGKATFNDIYIPSMENSQGIEANAMDKMGKITAADPSQLRDNGPLPDSGGIYRAGGYKITNSKSYVHISKPLQTYVSLDPNNPKQITVQEVPPNSQNTIIQTANFNDPNDQTVSVDVYGSNVNTIMAE